MPTNVGYQDLAALIAQQPGVSQRWREHVLTSPFGTIHAATFSFPRPMGSSIPDPFGLRPAAFDPRSLDVTGSIPRAGAQEPADPFPPIAFPRIDRSLKGDLLVPREKAKPEEVPAVRPQPADARDLVKAPEPVPAPEPAKRAEVPVAAVPAPPAPVALPPADGGTRVAALPPAAAPAPVAAPAPKPAVPVATPAPATVPPVDYVEIPRRWPAAPAEAGPYLLEGEQPVMENGVQLTDEEPGDEQSPSVAPADAENPSVRMARVYFGADAVGPAPGALQPWAEGEAPTLMMLHPLVDPNIKRAALDLENYRKRNSKEEEPAGETVAPKGEIKGGTGPMTPAERLGLSGAQRAKHERCLTNAIYFEARGEVERGQMAVAQVVLNRAFSGYYPDNVCGVVYQNAHRHLACQFTFACDNVRDVVTEPEAWETAKRIARDTLDGKLWVPEVGMSTHYHATYVHPWWVRTMRKQHRLGIHIFYRPTRWGDGADAPRWGPAASAAPSVGQAKL